ncbi:hypothetical protein B5D80_29065 [Micromonospora wenchangensis]|uniref:Uncharacterized protein n=1 Tax=Micromonospora wenchangensis TaxID=1185415 RepID=A0A2D0AWK5_9ACTN|nr:hypothetical protein [Micromonospora wenchangensis]OWU99615.1 hypothetical protein B5D80_29065 [Micromonospora wenchangensis]
MTELEQLRRAMRATERPYPEDLDLTVIMRDGRRLRRRRRLVGAGATALVTVLVAGGVGLGVRWARPPAADRPPARAATVPGATPPATSPPSPGPTRWRPPQQPIGEVIDTGIRYGVDQRVYYLVAVDVPEGPRVRVGLMAGRRTPAGELTNDIVINDVQGSDRRPGFHEIGYDDTTPSDARPPVPTFGYFVGPATRIVGTAGGRQVDARLARWSTDPELVVFWFDPVDLTPGVRLDGIVARDRSGRLL